MKGFAARFLWLFVVVTVVLCSIALGVWLRYSFDQQKAAEASMSNVQFAHPQLAVPTSKPFVPAP
jgi:flagellar basal body-associated protein FliL